MLLRDKVILISGIGPGMGQALARIAAKEGAKVGLGARNKEYVEQVTKEITAAGGKAIGVSCDITKRDQCDDFVAKTAEAFGGKIDGLVNSAVYHGDWGGTLDADLNDWRKIYETNVIGTLQMTQAAAENMKQHGGGAIVNVSTMATVKPYGFDDSHWEMGYAVAKGGVNVMGRYMSSDLGKYGIRVNTCRMGWIHGAPVEGFIQNQVNQGAKREDVVGHLTKDIPIGIIPPEDDCARGVLMFVSDYSRVVSGAVLDVNGGHWMAP
jgi:NAD(P)-dependent dehydrogenase (short-subunit alcohol dehydrogenase family)